MAVVYGQPPVLMSGDLASPSRVSVAKGAILTSKFGFFLGGGWVKTGATTNNVVRSTLADRTVLTMDILEAAEAFETN